MLLYSQKVIDEIKGRITFRWIVENEIERNQLNPTIEDINGLCFQKDNNSIWLLKSIESQNIWITPFPEGKSAFEIAKLNGFIGSEEEWIVSLKGENAYQLAILNGFNGSEEEWLQSLTTFSIAVKNGFTGTEEDWWKALSDKNLTNIFAYSAGREIEYTPIIDNTTASENYAIYTREGKNIYIRGMITFSSNFTGEFRLHLPPNITLKCFNSTSSYGNKYNILGNVFRKGEKTYTFLIVGSDKDNFITFKRSDDIILGTSANTYINTSFSYEFKASINEWQGSEFAEEVWDGTLGDSAYEVAVANGFVGTETQWLISLKGERGDPFKISKTYPSRELLENDLSPGLSIGQLAIVSLEDENNTDNGRVYTWNGSKFVFVIDMSGIQGIQGISAYEVAIQNGFEGTVLEWLASLKGENAYQLAVLNGFNGTEEEWLTHISAYGVAVANGFNGTEEEWLQSLKGENAYQLAVLNGFTGTQEQWLQSLIGTQGPSGSAIANLTETEERTHKFWFNKQVYRKVIYVDKMPVAEEKKIPHGIDNFEKVITLYGTAYNSSTGVSVPLPRIYTLSVANISVQVDKTDIIIRTQDNYSAYIGYVFIEYTKTNDIELKDDEIHKLQYAWLDGIPLTTVFSSGDLTQSEAERYGFIKIKNNVKYNKSDYLEFFEKIQNWNIIKHDDKQFWFNLINDEYTNTPLLSGGNIGSEEFSQESVNLVLGAWIKVKKTIMSFLPLNHSEAVDFLQSVKLDEEGIPEWNGKKWRGGEKGLSAYEVAVENGFMGTETEWLASFGAVPGRTAYEIAVENGFKGTEIEWLASLIGKTNYQIATDNGFTGSQEEWLKSLIGKTNYEIAVENGFIGTETEWLESIRGDTGFSAYEIAVENGFIGTETEWLISLIGKDGLSAYEVAIKNGFIGTEQDFINFLKGATGQSAYEIAVDYGFEGSKYKWLQSLKGESGKSAYLIAVDYGYEGTEKEWIENIQYSSKWGNISGNIEDQIDLTDKIKNIFDLTDTKVDKVDGKQLSTNDYITEDKILVNSIPDKLETKNIIAGKNINLEVNNNNVLISTEGQMPTEWGMITGSLSAQKDLINEFDDIIQILDKKVDKISGKQLSTNDYTNDEKVLVNLIPDKLESKDILPGKNVSINNIGNKIEISSKDQVPTEWGEIKGLLSNQTDLNNSLNTKVDKIFGKQLSTNDYITEDKILVNSIPDKLETKNIIAGKNINLEINNNNVLISTNDQVPTEWGMITGSLSAQEDLVDEFNDIIQIINKKVDKISGKQLSTNDYTNNEKSLVFNIPSKVDKVEGKQLSTNDYTNDDKTLVNIIPNKLETKNIIAGHNIEMNKIGNDITVSAADLYGASAYDIAVKNGYKGSEYEWLLSLHGPKGDKGDPFKIEKTFKSIDDLDGIGLKENDLVMIASTEDDPDNAKVFVWTNNKFIFLVDLSGQPGIKGENGKSAYEIAKENGFSGTEQEWLNQIQNRATWGMIDGSIDNQSDLVKYFNNKVDKVDGKQLSTNDFTNTYKTLVNTIPDKLESKDIVAGKNINIIKSGNEINISTEGQMPTEWGMITGSLSAQEDLIDEFDEINNKIEIKVDKISGKQLSTNDYTDNEKTLVSKIPYKIESSNILAGNNYLEIYSNKNDVYISVKKQFPEWGMITGSLSAQEDLLNEFNEIIKIFDTKVDKISGKQLSTNDYTNEDKQSLSKKLDKSNIIGGKNIILFKDDENNITISSIDPPQLKWGTITGDLSAQEDLIKHFNDKVDKVDGKQLSTNDFTNTYKAFVNAIPDKLETKNIIAGKNINIKTLENDVNISVEGNISTEWGMITGSLSAQKDLIDKFDEIDDSKVDKISGKQLSTNDYTNEDKTLVGKINNKTNKIDFDLLSIEVNKKIENIVPGHNINIKRLENSVEISAADLYGASAYDIAVKNGYLGTEVEWLLSLRGSKGDKGDPFKIEKTFKSIEDLDGAGLKENDLVMIASIEDDPDNAKVYIWDGYSFIFLVDLSGQPGIKGENGKSAYEIAKENGFSGTEQEWLAQLTANASWGTIEGNLENQKDLSNKLNTFVIKELNKQLSTNDYTNSDKQLVNEISNKLEASNIKAGSNINIEETGKNITISINPLLTVDWNNISGDINTRTDLIDKIEMKVDKISGKQLSTNDYTNEDKKSLSRKLELSNIKAGNNITLIENDNNIEISTADKLPAEWGMITGSLSAQKDIVDEFNDIIKIFETKVDKISGKQLSTNDYTNYDKNKVNSIKNSFEFTKEIYSGTLQLSGTILELPIECILMNDDWYVINIEGIIESSNSDIIKIHLIDDNNASIFKEDLNLHIGTNNINICTIKKLKTNIKIKVFIESYVNGVIKKLEFKCINRW